MGLRVERYPTHRDRFKGVAASCMNTWVCTWKCCEELAPQMQLQYDEWLGGGHCRRAVFDVLKRQRIRNPGQSLYGRSNSDGIMSCSNR